MLGREPGNAPAFVEFMPIELRSSDEHKCNGRRPNKEVRGPPQLSLSRHRPSSRPTRPRPVEAIRLPNKDNTVRCPAAPAPVLTDGYPNSVPSVKRTSGLNLADQLRQLRDIGRNAPHFSTNSARQSQIGRR